MIYKFDENIETPGNIPALHERFTQRMSNLTNDEIDMLVEQSKRIDVEQNLRIGIFGPYTDADVRGGGGMFHFNDENRWLYDRMATLSKSINNDDFQYDVTGFAEEFYNRSYEAPYDHFEWHVDATSRTPWTRKLTLVVQLSDPSEYEGGDFEFLGERGPIPTLKSKGIVTAFNSAKIHRVTPITKGVRRAMTMFLVGPNFR